MKKQLMRNDKKRIIAGVCGGLGEYFNVSPWIFRAIFIVPVLPSVLNFISGALSIIVYIILSMVIPDKKRIQENDVVEVDYEIVEDDKESEEA